MMPPRLDTTERSAKTDLICGLDVGGTKVEAMVVDSALHPVGSAVVSTDTRSSEALLASIDAAVRRAMHQNGSDAGRLVALGAGVPGQVDYRTGVVRNAVNLHLSHYPLGEMLRSTYHCPIAVENDVRLGALGAYHRLRQTRDARFQAMRNLAYLSIGTGFAAGLVLNGSLYRGGRGMAGELGHVQIDPNGSRCNCGARGCAETYLSGAGLVRLAQTYLKQRDGSLLHEAGGTLSAPAVFAAARQGDACACAIVDRFAQYIARLLYATALAYDVDYLVVSGGIAKAGPILHERVMHQVEVLRDQLPLARAMLDPASIIAMTDQNMGVWGGIMQAIDARIDQETMDHDHNIIHPAQQEQPIS